MTPSDKLNWAILPDSVEERKARPATKGFARKGYRRRPSATPSARPQPQHLIPKELPLQYYKGVGPARAQALARMGITSPDDLLTTYPRAWEDRRILHSIKDAPMGEKIALRGRITDSDIATTRRGLGIASAQLSDDTGTLEAAWYKKMNPRYDVFSGLRQRLQKGKRMLVFGAIEWGPHGKQLRVEDQAFPAGDDFKLDPEDRCHFDRIVPVYSVPEHMSGKFLRTLVARRLLENTTTLPESLPVWMLEHFKLAPRAWAERTIHFPETLLEKERARTRLAFDEFLALETALALLRQNIKSTPKPHHYELKRTLLTPFRQRLGFEFTGAQKRVIREIIDDMHKPVSMNRLLQGDVGSGKTVVALCAMLLAVENGGQAVLMAPTEILAEQHALSFQRLLGKLPVRTGLLTGSLKGPARQQLLKALAAGEIDLLIGTHALVQDHVQFSRLMLAVIDEQHRFGVEHRKVLRGKGVQPDVLVMTATPIPRTLALTLYGDLDVSILNELPPGRTPIQTRHVAEPEAYTRIREAVSRGEQAYVVYPLVKESDKLEVKAAVEEANLLQTSAFKGLRVGLLHGQLSAKDKEAIMQQFRRRNLDILIATSVIEVGIDVPNATVMTIQHAERFGLSTLHQLRGRVGRGALASFCLLIADCRNEDARRRIELMTQTQDGFQLSEEDLKMRGPGEVLGVQQHGLPEFRVGDLIQDAPLIQQARTAAEELLKRDPALRLPEHGLLKQAVLSQYASRWSLGTTG